MSLIPHTQMWVNLIAYCLHLSQLFVCYLNIARTWRHGIESRQRTIIITTKTSYVQKSSKIKMGGVTKQGTKQVIDGCMNESVRKLRRIGSINNNKL